MHNRKNKTLWRATSVCQLGLRLLSKALYCTILRKFLQPVIALYIMLFAPLSLAALNLELTQGKSAALPIAVVPFSGQTNNQDTASKQLNNIAYIITQDLQNSGQFYPLPWDKIGSAQTDESHYSAEYWRRLKVDDVLFGQVSLLPTGQFKISYSLKDAYNSSGRKSELKAPSPAGTMADTLLAQSFVVDPHQLRQAAHKISDAVYQALMGRPGIFSTRIGFVNWYISSRFDVSTSKAVPKYYWSLQVADADGFNQQTILKSPWPIMSPAWAPNGRKLAYVSFENNQASVYMQDIASGKRQLISRADGINGAPAFSPDGSQVAVVLSISGYSKIYTIKLPQGKPVLLIADDQDVRSIDTEPTWAPDGKSIVFTSDRGGSPQLYQYYLNSDGQRPVRLTFNGNYNAHSEFFPNGHSLVLMHRSQGNSIFNIAKLNLSNQQIQLLTQDISSTAPSVAPNGQMVVYSTTYGGRKVLAEVSVNGDIMLRLPLQSDKDAEGAKIEVKDPVWSPFLH